jgi:hypothetical protein
MLDEFINHQLKESEFHSYLSIQNKCLKLSRKPLKKLFQIHLRVQNLLPIFYIFYFYYPPRTVPTLKISSHVSNRTELF